MQLNNKSRSVRHNLALATASLLGVASQSVQAAGAEDWDIDTGILSVSYTHLTLPTKRIV